MANPITRAPGFSFSRFVLFGVLSAAAINAAGCGRVPPPPYALAFTADGQTPRVLYASDEIAVPLIVHNTGTQGWDAARVHVSYHWLWLVPRELVKRSRSVPYHDGIRSELPTPVAPGAGLSIEGRLLAPQFPGLYWLQWDMVEEGTTWFAQVSPRQPRHLIVVLPTPAGFVAPVPFLVVVAATVAFARRKRERSTVIRWVAAIDVVWCTAVLVAKPLILVREARLEPTTTAYFLILVAAFVPPVAAMAFLSRRVRRWTLLAFGVFCSLLIIGDILYYRFFGDVLSVPAMQAIRQAGQVSGSIWSLFTWEMIWLLIDLPFAFGLVLTMTRQSLELPTFYGRRAITVALVAIVLAGGIPALEVARSGRLDLVFRDRAVMEQLGPMGYHAYDGWTFLRATLFRPAVSESQVADARAWFAGRAPLRAGTGPFFGAAKGKNLVVIQVESLQDFIVDYRIGGQAVMPHLRQWTEDAIRFTNVTDQTNQGRTSDAEFTALTSLLPLDRGAAAFLYAGDHYVGLPRVHTEHGYTTLSAVAFEAGFWNRRVMHPAYGFQQSLFEPDFQLTEQIGWGLNDHDFLQQMVPRLARMKKPFGAWLITLSLHHPFDDFPDRHKVLRLGPLEKTSFGNYVHTMRFFDTALNDFQSALQRAGLLDDTMLVVFGDHDAGFPRDKASSNAIGIGADDVSWMLNDRIPFFIRLPASGAEDIAGARATTAGQTDFAPTLLALLGIDPAPLPYVGRNLLGQPDDPPVVRPSGDWLDHAHLSINRSASNGRGICYSFAVPVPIDPSACVSADEAARHTRLVSQLVVSRELQQQLRDSLK